MGNTSKKLLRSYRIGYGVAEKTYCTQEENNEYYKILKEGGTLPEGVYQTAYNDEGSVASTEFYTVKEIELTESERMEYLTYKQLDLLRTIKNCVVFFTVLAVIGMAIALISLLNMLG